MQIFLLRSENSALRTNPVHGVFTDSNEADEAVDAFKEAESAVLKERWKSDWKHFASIFYVEPLTANIPVEELIAGKYKD